MSLSQSPSPNPDSSKRFATMNTSNFSALQGVESSPRVPARSGTRGSGSASSSNSNSPLVRRSMNVGTSAKDSQEDNAGGKHSSMLGDRSYSCGSLSKQLGDFKKSHAASGKSPLSSPKPTTTQQAPPLACTPPPEKCLPVPIPQRSAPGSRGGSYGMEPLIPRSPSTPERVAAGARLIQGSVQGSMSPRGRGRGGAVGERSGTVPDPGQSRGALRGVRGARGIRGVRGGRGVRGVRGGRGGRGVARGRGTLPTAGRDGPATGQATQSPSSSSSASLAPSEGTKIAQNGSVPPRPARPQRPQRPPRMLVTDPERAANIIVKMKDKVQCAKMKVQKRIATEMLQTEANYSKSLKSLCEDFVRPWRQVEVERKVRYERLRRDLVSPQRVQFSTTLYL